MPRALHDLKRALIRLFKTPSFTLLCVLTLGIGIGANTSIFTVVYNVLLRPLPYPESERLVALGHTAPGLDLDRMPQSEVTYLLYRDHSKELDSIALYDDDQVTLTGGERPEQVAGARVTSGLFDVLATRPIAGRVFDRDASRPEAPPVAVVSARFVARRFGEPKEALGKTLRLDGESHEIIGVLPAEFAFPAAETELWLPMPINEADPVLGAFGAGGIGRLAAGVTVPELKTEFDGLIANLDEFFPGMNATPLLQNAGFAALVSPYRDEVVGDVGSVLWVVMGAVIVVLLIAGANVANLFMVRAEGQLRESAIRSALGASRLDLVRAELFESGFLGLLGGVVGLVLAVAGLRLLVRLEPGNLPRLDEIRIDGTVLLFTLGLSLLAGLLFGLLPAIRGIVTSKFPLLLKEGARTGVGKDRQLARNVLVAFQVFLAFSLLVGCGLMVRSFSRLSAVDPGLDAKGVLSFRLFLPASDYPDDTSAANAHQSLVERLESIPGVVSVGATTEPPLNGSGSGSGHQFEDYPLAENEPPKVLYFRQVTSDFFATLGVPLLEGRFLERADHEERRRVVVVNEAVARRYWPNGSALNKRLAPGRVTDDQNWFTIVGVVGSIRNAGLNEPPPEMVYYPMLQPLPEGDGDDRADRGDNAPRGMSYMVRTEGDPTAIADAVRQEVWSVDPNLPIAGLEPLSRGVARVKARWSFLLILLAIASAVALLLGGIGIYGVISYIVAHRTPELGIRLALGAQRGDVSAMVVRQALAVAVVGLVPGIVVALAVGRAMRSILFEVSPFDPVTFVLVALALLMAAAFASLMPAYRASRIDPVQALKQE